MFVPAKLLLPLRFRLVEGWVITLQAVCPLRWAISFYRNAERSAVKQNQNLGPLRGGRRASFRGAA